MLSLRTLIVETKWNWNFEQLYQIPAELPGAIDAWIIKYKGPKGTATIENALPYFNPNNVKSSREYFNKDHVFVIKTKREGNKRIVFYIGAYRAADKPAGANKQITTPDGTFWTSVSDEQKAAQSTSTSNLVTTTPTSADATAEPKVSTTTDTTTSTSDTTTSKPVQIKYGMRGDEVEVAQNYLIRKLEKTPIVDRPEWKKFMSYGADGKYGDATGRLVWGLHKVYGLTPSKNLTPELIAKLETIQESIKLRTLREQNWDAFDTRDYVSTKKPTTPKPKIEPTPNPEVIPSSTINIKDLTRYLHQKFPKNFITPRGSKNTAWFMEVVIGQSVTKKSTNYLVPLKSLITDNFTNIDESMLLQIINAMAADSIEQYKAFHELYKKINGTEFAYDVKNAFNTEELVELRNIAIKHGYTYSNDILVKQQPKTTDSGNRLNKEV